MDMSQSKSSIDDLTGPDNEVVEFVASRIREKYPNCDVIVPMFEYNHYENEYYLLVYSPLKIDVKLIPGNTTIQHHFRDCFDVFIFGALDPLKENQPHIWREIRYANFKQVALLLEEMPKLKLCSIKEDRLPLDFRNLMKKVTSEFLDEKEEFPTDEQPWHICYSQSNEWTTNDTPNTQNTQKAHEVVKLKKQIKNMIDIAHKHIFPHETKEQVEAYFGIKTTPRNKYTVEHMNK